jgi:hypothetical protein
MGLISRALDSADTYVKKFTNKGQELRDSDRVNLHDLKSVCLALGPYRNLTTLTASILFLHPNCQVLNHAGKRIFGDRKLDFLSDYSSEKFENFARYAIHISEGGERGNYGGSITHSHAFRDQSDIKDVWDELDLNLKKQEIHSLFWKESQRTANRIRNKNVDLDDIFHQNERLRFLLPVRNPMDSAMSNMKTGHVRHLKGVNKRSDIDQVLEAILDEFAWFAELQQQHPDRFLAYFAHEAGRESLKEIANFLDLDLNETWLGYTEGIFVIKSKYTHHKELIAHFRHMVNEKFALYPEFQEKLLGFVQDG